MYFRSTNTEYAEMTTAKEDQKDKLTLLVEASERNQRCLGRMFDELKSIFLLSIDPGMCGSALQSFWSKLQHGTYAA